MIFDDYVKKIVLISGKMLTEKIDIPDIGEWASFEDTEGNISGILKSSMESMQRYQEMHKK
jgi:predicted enzyme related to lactoylglutathione lyase